MINISWIKQHNIYVLSYLLFFISLAAPAVSTQALFSDKNVIHHGLECMIIAYLQIPDFFNFNKETYVSFLALANTVMLISPVIRIFPTLYFSTAFFIYMLLSTLLILLTPYTMNNIFADNFVFLTGYYLWSIAFILSCSYIAIQKWVISKAS